MFNFALLSLISIECQDFNSSSQSHVAKFSLNYGKFIKMTELFKRLSHKIVKHTQTNYLSVFDDFVGLAL